MSALNQAFIKAYAKGTSPRVNEGPRGGEPEPDAWQPTGSWFRADGGRGTVGPAGTHGPHLRFATSSNAGDLSGSPAGTIDAFQQQVDAGPAWHHPSTELPWHAGPLLVMPTASAPAGNGRPATDVPGDGSERPRDAGRTATAPGERLDSGAAAAEAEPAAGRTTTAPPAFAPVWEVDQLTWPAICDDFERAGVPDLIDSGSKLKMAAEQGLRVLAVAGAQPKAGATTLALALARSAAQAGVRVALVDAHWRSPALAQQLNLQLNCGWQDALHGPLTLEETAVASLDDRLVLLPLTAARWPANEPTAAQASRLVGELAASFELVILDLGTADDAADWLHAAEGSNGVDAVILVRDLRQTSFQQVQRQAEQIMALGVEAVGIAENFVPPRDVWERAAA